MELLYIASTEPRSGKTILAGALGLLAREKGLRPAYRRTARDAEEAEADVAFLRNVLGDAGRLAVPTLGGGSDEVIPSPGPSPEVLQRLAPGADLLLVEGDADPRLAVALGARVLLLAWYREGLTAGEVRAAAEPFGARLAGLLLNGVPALRQHHVETSLLPALVAAGLPALGALPQSRVLMAATLRELVSFLEARVLAFPEGLDELVERVMIGALALDGGLYYYGQADRKVVITRWDRPDLQMPALATGCQGLILTGGQGPIPYVWNRVQELRVPVAVVPGGTIATASRLNGGLLAQRGHPHARKVQAMASLLEGLPEVLALLPAVGR